MKKRFKNILIKTGKKNGVVILLCVIVLTISLGTLAGCSINESDGPTSVFIAGKFGNGHTWVIRESDNENLLEEGSDNSETENTTMPTSSEEVEKSDKTALKVMREGGMDEIPATLFVGEGYSIYLTDDNWKQYASDIWFATVDGYPVLHGQVQLWIVHYEYKTLNQVKEELTGDGYVSEISDKNSDMVKQKGEVVYKVRLNELENDIWAIFYSYPIEAEEGWGAVLPVIADTFALSQNSAHEVTIESADIQEIKSIIEEFSAYYFSGDADALQKFLTSPYEWDIDTYEGTGTVGDFTIKGLPEVGERNAKNRWAIELEFMDSDDDSYTYLCFIFVKQEESWKIQFYGLEK